MTRAIRCQDLRKTYPGRPPVEAVRGIDLEIAVGECFGVLGPNGAGKTTTIEILEGLMPASGGSVEVLGARWGTRDEELRQRIGISLQETRLSEKLTVRETLTLFRSFYRRGLEPQETLQQVSLQDKADAYIKNLSGGQKQRLALACALVGDPEILFLDEPTTGLDPQSRRQVWGIVEQFGRQGRTVLLTTHYLEEAERLCDRVAIVDHGKVIANGSPAQLIATLGGDHVIEFSLAAGEPWSADPLRDLPTVTEVRCEDGHYALSVTQPHVALPPLLTRLGDARRELTSLAIRHASLDDVFVKLAGRHIEDLPAEGETA